jgi:hypothetical protein
VKPEDTATLIQYRLEQAQTALDDAKYLLDGNRSPQSVINRAYYAMFYAVLALLQKTGKIPSKHTGVIGLFDVQFVVAGLLPRELSRDLHKAFELRQVSDYKVSQPLTRAKAEEVLANATRFVEAITAHIPTASDAGRG